MAIPPTSAYVYVDLGAIKPIGSIRWVFALEGAADAMLVQVSSDRATWTTLTQATNAPAGAWQAVAAGLNARYVRLYFTNPNGDPTLGGLGEVEVWP